MFQGFEITVSVLHLGAHSLESCDSDFLLPVLKEWTTALIVQSGSLCATWVQSVKSSLLRLKDRIELEVLALPI